MRNDYFTRKQTANSKCKAAMAKAENAFINNGNQHCVEECAYLQEAANLRSEMARMSTGEERAYQQSKLQELNAQIEAIRRICDQDYIQRNQARAAAAPQKSAPRPTAGGSCEGGTPNASKSGAGKGRSAVTDEDVAKWYKPAPKHSFDDVSGMSELKEQLRSCVKDSQNSALRDFLGMKNIHSFFFIGPPGCGKTYIIEAFAHELMNQDYKFISLDGSDIRSKFVGDAEKIVTRLFEEAEKNAPCIVFIDEVDSVCKNRSLPDLPEYAASITTAFLTGYNRINSADKSVIFIGATNYPNQVDNAMLDRVELIRVPFPDQEARESAFHRHLDGKLQTEEALTFQYMGEQTVTYNYRDIDRLVERLKQEIYRQLKLAYPADEDAVRALQSGEYRLTRALFDEIRANCLATPKDSIIRELDEWESKFNSAAEQGD